MNTPQQNIGPQVLQTMWQSFHRQSPQIPQAKFNGAIVKLVQQGAKFLQIRNTVFLMFMRGNGVIEFHTFTNASPQELIQDAKFAVQKVKQAGAKKLITFTKDPRLVQIAQQTGLPWKQSQTPKGTMLEVDL